MTHFFRWLRRGLVVALLCIVAFAAWAWNFAWRRLPHYNPDPAIVLAAPILTPAEYDAVFETHARPFIIEIEHPGGGAALVYGASHTRDPDDPQIADLTARFEAFRPTVALCESRQGILFPGLMEPTREFGESGTLRGLAIEAGIPVYSWEPPASVVIESLRASGFTDEQIALRLRLGPYFSNLRYGRPEDPEAFVADFFNDPERFPGLEEVLPTIAEIDAAWKRHFPEGPDWRDVSDETRLPGFLGEISTNRPRDEHFARVVIDLVERGERVIATAGSSHAVTLEPALRASLSGP